MDFNFLFRYTNKQRGVRFDCSINNNTPSSEVSGEGFLLRTKRTA